MPVLTVDSRRPMGRTVKAATRLSEMMMIRTLMQTIRMRDGTPSQMACDLVNQSV